MFADHGHQDRETSSTPPGSTSPRSEPPEASATDGSEVPDTLHAPSFHPPVAPTEHHAGSSPAHTAGELSGQISDFQIERELGRGASGSVYLARQISLDRRVALKASIDSDGEALTMAQLEHPHIVQVYSEEVEASTGLRLLCMQLVPGITLQELIDCLGQRDRAALSGRDLLAILDQESPLPEIVELHGMRNREFLAGCDFLEAICWIGARLAEALVHAHRRGVLHCDIKPANILLDHYGRPLLADFSLSLRTSLSSSTSGGRFGGTLGYMAPEHLDAFNPEHEASADQVDERSDIFSLGVVLYQQLTGELPFERPSASESKTTVLRRLAADRRSRHVTLRHRLPEVPDALERTIRRCLEPDSNRRYADANQLVDALEGCRELAGVERRLPTGGVALRAIERHALVSILVISFIPHWLGTAASALCGAVRLFPQFTPQQRTMFALVVVVGTLGSYPVFLGLFAWYLRPVIRAWRSFRSATDVSADEVVQARRRIVGFTGWAARLQAIGWAIMFALVGLSVRLLAGSAIWHEFPYFLTSFGLSALIAMTYSLLVIEYLCLRALYPRLWPEVGEMRQTASAELASVPFKLKWLQFASGALPLLGALVLVLAGGRELAGYELYVFRGLAIALILLALFGFQFSAVIVRRMRESLDVLCGHHGSRT